MSYLWIASAGNENIRIVAICQILKYSQIQSDENNRTRTGRHRPTPARDPGVRNSRIGLFGMTPFNTGGSLSLAVRLSRLFWPKVQAVFPWRT
jgi:hypothetical protein